MGETQWVQHLSGQGEKYEVITETGWSSVSNCEMEWVVYAKISRNARHYLPKSEYVPCDPPQSEEWEDVTADCEAARLSTAILYKGHVLTTEDNDFRVQKFDGPHQGPAFTVKRRKV